MMMCNGICNRFGRTFKEVCQMHRFQNPLSFSPYKFGYGYCPRCQLYIPLELKVGKRNCPCCKCPLRTRSRQSLKVKQNVVVIKRY